METLNVVVIGAAGRMGVEIVRHLSSRPGIHVVGAVDNRMVGEPVYAGCPLVVEAKLGEVLDRVGADVAVDFTTGSAAPDNAQRCAKRGVSPVIGVSGLNTHDIRAIRDACREAGVPGMIGPNFAIGAVLMAKFAEMAAAWMPDAEIIEMHHDGKLDSPSGTAIHTAERIAEGRRKSVHPQSPSHETFPGARGATVKNVAVHAVRLKGLVAHQRVMFGGQGELLTLSHDSLDRTSFMAGVELAVRKVRGLEGLVIGLDKLMFDDD